MTYTDIAAIAAIPDPVERIHAASAATEVVRRELALITHEAVLGLQASGMSTTQIGAALGITRGRAHQLTKPPAERPR